MAVVQVDAGSHGVVEPVGNDGTVPIRVVVAEEHRRRDVAAVIGVVGWKMLG